MSNDLLSCPSPSSDYFFEGAEKLLEVWFGKGSSSQRDLDSGSERDSGSSDEDDQVEQCDLRIIPRLVIKSILRNCWVILRTVTVSFELKCQSAGTFP